MKNITLLTLVLVLALSTCAASKTVTPESEPIPLVIVVAGQSNAGRLAAQVAAAGLYYGYDATVINCADIAGGSSIWDWQWDGFLNRRCRAMVADSGLAVDAVFFHQGERDAQSDLHDSGQMWHDYMVAVITCFRSSVSNPDLPFVVGQISPYLDPVDFPQMALVRTQQKIFYNTPYHETKVAFSGGIPLGPDGIHYEPADAYVLAQRFWLAYIALVSE